MVTFSAVRPLRVCVFGHVWQRGRLYAGRGPNNRGARTAIEPILAGWHAWTPDTTAEPHREGYGSFCYLGGLRALAAARRAFRQSGVTQVQIRTNQDRKVLIFNRRNDGRIDCYSGLDD